MNGSDTGTMIMRAQLYLEHVLIQTLRDEFRVPKAIDLRRINFASKLNLCVALGLFPVEWCPSVNKVNEMRNRMAHNLDAEFTDDDKRSLWVALPSFLKIAILEHLRLREHESDEVKFADKLKTLILRLDIARQKAGVRRVHEHFAEEHLRRVLSKVHPREEDM